MGLPRRSNDFRVGRISRKDAVPVTVNHTLVRVDFNSGKGLLYEMPSSIQWPLDSIHKDLTNNESEDAA